MFLGLHFQAKGSWHVNCKIMAAQGAGLGIIPSSGFSAEQDATAVNELHADIGNPMELYRNPGTRNSHRPQRRSSQCKETFKGGADEVGFGT